MFILAGKRHTILIVDDDPGIRDSLQISLELDYDVLTAPGGAEALELLTRHEVALIITDQRMPEMTGVAFLEKAQQISPNSVRMMLTGFADFDAIVHAINQGQIYRYIAKPWEPRELEMDVRRAVESYELKVSLDRRMHELRTLCEIGATITSVLDVDEVIQTILNAVVETLGLDRSFLMLVKEGEGVLCSRACAGASPEVKAFFSGLEYRLDREDIAVVRTLREDCSILVEDVENPPVPVDRESIHRMELRSFVTAPLRAGDRRIGVLMADRIETDERVTDHDQRLLIGFANQAAIAIENARLYSEALEKKRLEEEVALAGRIQLHLLPQTIPQVDGFDLVGRSLPNRAVSGDYFDVLKDPSGKVWVALGDVSGKGVPAALTMATLRSLFRSELEREHSLSESMRRIGVGLWHCTAPEVFATFCFGVLDPLKRTFRFVNAGHPFPLLVRANGESCVAEGAGMPVGIDPALAGENSYPEQQIKLDPGDVLVIYSDGITEAGSAGNEMFGDERLESVVSRHRSNGAGAVQAAVCDAVDEFLGNSPPDDDLTMVVIGAKENGSGN